jgi:H+/Cl- antiporter ClcA
MRFLKLSFLAVQVGVLAGLSSTLFLWLLEIVTAAQSRTTWLLWLLPLAGLAVGVINHRSPAATNLGTSAVLAQARTSTAALPLLIAPTVLVTTLLTHLFGGSAGREGTAVQMSAGLADPLIAGPLNLNAPQRSALLRVAIAGGFGAVFGVPLAGAVFGLEVMRKRVPRTDRHLSARIMSAAIPALIASVIGDQIVLLFGIDHLVLPTMTGPEWSSGFIALLLPAGIVFGVAAALFAVLTRMTSRVLKFLVPSVILRPAVGGVLVVLVTLGIGTRDYLGLSLPLITDSLTLGVGVASGAFLAKIVFTSLTLGSGFRGGEVTPLFVIGATLGASLGQLVNVDPPTFAALGLIAVFASAARTPLACVVMAYELFGSAFVLPAAIVCGISHLMVRHRGVYV